MNFIDQALKDKLKLFDEIDRELGTESSYKNTTNKINNNLNQFDKIYSNFLLDQYKPKNLFIKTTTKTNSNNNTINNNQIAEQFNVQIQIKILFYQMTVEIVCIITDFI